MLEMKRLLASAFVSVGVLVAFLIPVPVGASTYVAQIDVFEACDNISDSDICKASANSKKLFGPGSIWNSILNTLTFVIGAVAVLMIIIGALRYALSGGDSGTLTSAKNTIIYALVALIVAVMANAIVNFVLTAL